METSDDPQQAETLNQFMLALKRRGVAVPLAGDFPPKSELRRIWEMKVKVEVEGDVYRATTMPPYEVVPGYKGSFFVVASLKN